MKERQTAEDWLLLLHYGLECILCPSPARILESFEAFEYRHRLRRQFRRLEGSGLLQKATRKGGPMLRLTREGARRAEGDVALMEQWNRPWDGRWRMLMFDLPARDPAPRVRSWRWLRSRRLGFLQNSVWISPAPFTPPLGSSAGFPMAADSCLILEATACGPVRDREIAAAAWDFESLHQSYAHCQEVLAEGEDLVRVDRAPGRSLRRWLARERQAWLAAMAEEPLLPRRLYPADYPGELVLRRRQELFSRLSARCLLTG